MSKKISKKASAIRTVSLAVGSLSLLTIAISQVAGNEACTSNSYSFENQLRLSWVVFLPEYLNLLDSLGDIQEIFSFDFVMMGSS